MANVVCQVINQDDQMEFIWSAGGGFFDPYVIKRPDLTALRNDAATTREALEKLVSVRNNPGSPEKEGVASRELAEAGYQLFNRILPFFRAEASTSKAIRGWLKGLNAESARTSLEIVVEENANIAADECAIPWNLVYDTDPDDDMDASAEGDDRERWRPFWGIRYDLTCGRRVEPLRRQALWTDPRVVVVVDPTAYGRLHEDQKRRLDEFLAARKIDKVETLERLKRVLRQGQPRLLYWLGHARPEFLRLGEREVITPRALEDLLIRSAEGDQSQGILVFLNACQTGESGQEEGSFPRVLKELDFCRGAILTERQTIDNFANGFGLDFLEGFLDRGESVGDLLHRLRLDHAPLGLIYGAYCPPEIRVRVGPQPRAEEPPEIGDRPVAPGVVLWDEHASPLTLATDEPLTLPDHPYRSLYYFDRADRLLFTGRDADVVRFAATLDRPDTRILVLQGESGIGKSSFLRAGVIPYLEEECVGYRFLRDAKEEVVIIQASKDPVGRLAVGLLEMTECPQKYLTPTGDERTSPLRSVLDEALGTTADAAALRAALMADPDRLATLLERLSAHLPHALVLVLDQAEELFTLAKERDEIDERDQALRLLQRVADVRADVKVIISLRTEYYGRLHDHLRVGRRDLTGVRDDLLRDFSKTALIEAIERPTLETPLVEGQPSPRQRYGFSYADGVAAAIAAGVLRLRSANRDSVLPLIQVICTRLSNRGASDPATGRVVTLADLEAIGGVEGGLKAFAEDALEVSMGLGPEDRDAFKAISTRLYTRQADGTLTTWLALRATLEEAWNGSKRFGDVLEEARQVRLLREDDLRIEGEEPQAYIRLGHDALAKVAAAWRAEREEQEQLQRERKQRRRLIGWLVVFGSLAAIFGLGGGWICLVYLELDQANMALKTAEINAKTKAEHARIERDRASKAEAEAKHQEQIARARLARNVFDQVARLWRIRPEQGRQLLVDEKIFRPEERDFTWGYYMRLCDRVRIVSGERPLHAAFSPDGRILASAVWGLGIQLLDPGTGKIRATLKGTGGMAVLRVAFSPNGKILASTGRGGTVWLWDPDAQKIRAILKGHAGPVNAIAFSRDGKILASGGKDGAVWLWDPDPGKIRATLKGQGGQVHALAFSPDGKTLAVGGHDLSSPSKLGELQLWDPDTGKIRASPRGQEGEVLALAFSPDGKTLAVGGRDLSSPSKPGELRLCDPDTGKIRATHRHARPVYGLAFSPDGKILAETSGDPTNMALSGEVWLWDATTGLFRGTLTSEHEESVVEQGRVDPSSSSQFRAPTVIAFSPDGKTLASADRAGTVLRWDVATCPTHPILSGHFRWVTAVAFSRPDGKVLASAGVDGKVLLWDVDTLQTRATLRDQKGEVRALAFSPDGKILASAGRDGTVRLWDPDMGRAPELLTGNKEEVFALAFSPDGKVLASAGVDRTVRLWDVDTRQPRATLTGHKDWVLDVAFSPDGRTLASVGGSSWTPIRPGEVRLWDPATGRPRPSLLGHAGAVAALAFSGDGRTLVSASDDGTVRLWDAMASQPRAPPLEVHERGHWTPSVAFSRDGRTLAVNSRGVSLWDVSTGEPLANVTGDALFRNSSSRAVTKVAFSPDGKTLASAHYDGVVRLWVASFPTESNPSRSTRETSDGSRDE
jgi:WD40 repeat protein